jgi:hypothetical protein
MMPQAPSRDHPELVEAIWSIVKALFQRFEAGKETHSPEPALHTDAVGRSGILLYD